MTDKTWVEKKVYEAQEKLLFSVAGTRCLLLETRRFPGAVGDEYQAEADALEGVIRGLQNKMPEYSEQPYPKLI